VLLFLQSARNLLGGILSFFHRPRFRWNPYREEEEIKVKANCLLMILLTTLTASLAAQDMAAPFPATPSADRDKIATEPLFGAAVTSSRVGSPVLTKPERVFDKKFFVVMGSLAGAESFRSTSRKLVVEREFAAGAPWITSVPSNSSIVGRNLGLFAAEFLVAYEFKKSHLWLPGDRRIRNFWWAYPAAMTAIHIKNAVGNVRTQGPGGCTSIECAMQSQ
jgi:hypothetical protein